MVAISDQLNSGNRKQLAPAFAALRPKLSARSRVVSQRYSVCQDGAVRAGLFVGRREGACTQSSRTKQLATCSNEIDFFPWCMCYAAMRCAGGCSWKLREATIELPSLHPQCQQPRCSGRQERQARIQHRDPHDHFFSPGMDCGRGCVGCLFALMWAGNLDRDKVRKLSDCNQLGASCSIRCKCTVLWQI